MPLRVLLAHGAGSSSAHPHLVRLAALLQAAGMSVTPFDFPYRRQGRQLPDKMPTLLEAFRHEAQTLAPDPSASRLFLAGHSLGGRVALRLAAEGLVCAGVLLFSYPLRAATGKGALRLEGFRECRERGLPVLLLAGDRDPLCPADMLKAEMRAFPKVTTVLLPGQDHGWSGLARGPKPSETDASALSAVRVWLNSLHP